MNRPRNGFVNQKKTIFSLTLGIGLLLFLLRSEAPLLADQRGPTMNIVLVPVGTVNPAALEMLKEDLCEVLQKAIWVGKGLGEPYYAKKGMA
jgi:hypothetical protein